MSSRFPVLRGVIKWPPTVAAIIATSGLIIALFAVSHHIWRGGGKRAKDPDWANSRKRSREKLSREKKRSISESTPSTSKGGELLWEESPKRTRLSREAETNLNIGIKSSVLTETPNLLSNVAEGSIEAVTTKIVCSSSKENEQSLKKLGKETETEALLNVKPILLEEEPQAQALALGEIKAKVEIVDKLITFAEIPAPQLKAAKETEIEVPIQEKHIFLEEKPRAPHALASSLETKETTKTKPVEKQNPQLSKVLEINIKEKLVNGEVEFEVKKSNHTLSNGFTDDILKNEAEKCTDPVSGKNLDNVHSPEVTSTSENLKQEVKSQFLGEGIYCSVFKGSGKPRKEVFELSDQTNLISKTNNIVLTQTSSPTKIEDTTTISGIEALGKTLENKSDIFDAGKKHESVLVSSLGVKQTADLRKIEGSQLDKVQEAQAQPADNISGADKQFTSTYPSTVNETVQIVKSVICDLSELKLKSLDSLNISSEEVKQCPDSPETAFSVNPVGIDKPLKVQLCESNYIDDSDNTLEGNCDLPSNDIEGDKELRSTLASDRVVEEVISLECQSGKFKDIPFTSSGHLEVTNKNLKDILVSSSRTEKSEDILLEREKVVKLKQGAVAGDFLDCEDGSVEEVLSKGEGVTDVIEAGKGGKTKQIEGKDISNERGTVSEVAAVPVEDTVEVAVSFIAESGSSALGNQVEVATVKPNCITVGGLTEEGSEVCPLAKDISKTLKSNDNNSDPTLNNKAEVRESLEKEVSQSQLEEREMLTKGTETNSDLVKGKSGGGGKRKGKKGKKMQEETVEKMVEKMEVKEIIRESEECILQNGDVGEDHSGKPAQVHANGISSPPTPNFPDNRSEGSSCGDSGKGRSDVTTPGGLEEELREVNFSHHFSPPCSTSGREEEEERVRRASGSTGEDGSREEIGSAIGGEEIIEETTIVVGNDGLVMPVPVPIYHGMVPITPPPSVYEFVIPQELVGRLIGKHGSFVNHIKARTSATIFIKTHPETNKLKVCAIEGTDDEIQDALNMIREKFPLRRYSSMTLEQVFFLPLPPPTFTLIPDSLPLQLVEGVSNDVILSALVSPNHYFLQQPTHPTYPTLAKLDMWMSVCYQDANAPMLPEDVKAGIICAAPTMGGWYRAQIVAVEELPSTAEDESVEEGELIKWCDVRFVDYGGYERLPSHSLRQIRSDFMTLPFQASECYLANVVPAPTSDENKMADGWSMEALALVESLTQAQVLQAQVVGQARDGLPLVLLYAFSHSMGQVVQVNNELINRGLAVWAMPVVEADHSIYANGSENLSGDETPQEDQPEMAVA
ncbi:uncharacterized protein spoon [Hetaerina americana]|uniref:uncharacterized protein spoon n=1 Tax=Hetaerina americana TaxID=62018 RepID=UPI003A7F17D1